MRLESKMRFAASIVLLIICVTSPILKGQASESQDLEFEIIDSGDLSGYFEETYLVVRNETEWAEVWKNHTLLCTSPCGTLPPRPDIAFSEKMVICAFMGRRSTAGYSISIERIWAEKERINVVITKHNPPENALVAQILTHPYVFASLERTDLKATFHVTEEDGTITLYTLPEFPAMTFALIVFVGLSAAMVALMRKVQRNKPRH